MNVNWRIFVNALFALLLVSTFSCEDDNEVGTARLQVLLTDDPADYEEVNVEIIDVQINPEDDDEGWVSLENVNTGIFDLLELTGGLEAVLADVELPAGRLNQIRLILGDENTVVIDGDSKNLDTPSAQQSGLKIQLNTELNAGATYAVLLDFDAAQSVVQAGQSGKFLLKPVIHASLEATGGGISGLVSPPDVPTVVYAIQGEDSVSTYTNDMGEFLVRGLAAGAYTLSIVPNEDSGLSEEQIDNVDVVAGETTDVGTIDLEN